MSRKPKKPPAQIARECLKAKSDKMEVIRERLFHLDEVEAHDDDLHEQCCQEYAAQFESIRDELVQPYGKPVKAGKTDHPLVPLNGVFCYAVWKVDGKRLFLAAAREDRECPMLLVMGAVADG